MAIKALISSNLTFVSTVFIYFRIDWENTAAKLEFSLKFLPVKTGF